MTVKKATKATKARAETEPKKAPFTIDEEISCGQIHTGDNKAVGISLVRHESNRYIALSKMYLAKDGTYKSKGGMWIPFDSANSVSNLITKAYNKGMEFSWDKPYIPPEPELELEVETLPPPPSPTEEIQKSSNPPALPPEISNAINHFSELVHEAKTLSDKLQGQIDSVKKLQTVETINNKSFLKNLLNIK